MREYIERAYIMGKITASETQAKLKQMDGAEAYNKMLSIVNSAPASDVSPVRHGKWLDCENYNDIEQCSECGMIYKYPSLYKYNYCPNCGAKMDGGGNG